MPQDASRETLILATPMSQPPSRWWRGLRDQAKRKALPRHAVLDLLNDQITPRFTEGGEGRGWAASPRSALLFVASTVPARPPR